MLTINPAVAIKKYAIAVCGERGEIQGTWEGWEAFLVEVVCAVLEGDHWRKREQGLGRGFGKRWGENRGSELEKHLGLQLRSLRPRGVGTHPPSSSEGHTGMLWEPRSSFILSRDTVLMNMGAEDGCPARAS